MASQQQFSLRQRLRYRFDNTLSRGLWAVLAWLGLIAVIFLAIVALVIWLSGIGPGDERTSLGDGIWQGLMHVLDPGAIGGAEGAGFRWLMLAVTLIGIFLAAAIIGMVSSSIDTRLDELRRGKSIVIETGHTLVIGRSDKLPAVVNEIIEANRSVKDRAIVVFTPDDGVEVSDELHASIDDLASTRVVVRSGAPTRTMELTRANPESASSAIVLRGDGESDAHVVKAVLALARLVPGLEGLTVVAEIEDPGTADSLRAAVGESLVTVVPNSIIARLTAQVSRAAGLGPVYQELLDFAGDEIYFHDIPTTWIGRTYGELLLASSTATIIGLRDPQQGVVLNPDTSTVIVDGSQAIGICEDDSAFVLDLPVDAWAPADDRRWEPLPPQVEKMLILGWSSLGPLIVDEIDRQVAPGSQLRILVDPAVHSVDDVRRSVHLSSQSVVIQDGNPTNRNDIASALDEGPYDHIMLLCEREAFDMDEADARTLLGLMLVRGSLGDSQATDSIVAEVLDPSDVELGGGDSMSDFIVSQKLISLLMAQLSENPHLDEVFQELLGSEGIILDLHPVSRYVEPGAMTFGDIVGACREWGVSPIGYRRRSATGDLSVRVNPAKAESVTLGEDDLIVVLCTNPAA